MRVGVRAGKSRPRPGIREKSAGREDTMIRKLLPKNVEFFDYFEKHIALTIQGCEELIRLLTTDGKVDEHVSRIKEIEHMTDTLTSDCIDALHKTFITPIDRGDIHRLIRRLDDIIDAVDTVAQRLSLYEIKDIRSEAPEVAEVLLKAAFEVQNAIRLLSDMKNAQKIVGHCISVYQLENSGDTILHNALVRLFKEEKDPIQVIKWKELFEILEKAVDRCEDAANIIQGVVIEAS
jgi:predicted phosphate transport protein (TIGR00153 family)